MRKWKIIVPILLIILLSITITAVCYKKYVQRTDEEIRSSLDAISSEIISWKPVKAESPWEMKAKSIETAMTYYKMSREEAEDYIAHQSDYGEYRLSCSFRNHSMIQIKDVTIIIDQSSNKDKAFLEIGSLSEGYLEMEKGEERDCYIYALLFKKGLSEDEIEQKLRTLPYRIKFGYSTGLGNYDGEITPVIQF